MTWAYTHIHMHHAVASTYVMSNLQQPVRVLNQEQWLKQCLCAGLTPMHFVSYSPATLRFTGVRIGAVPRHQLASSSCVYDLRTFCCCAVALFQVVYKRESGGYGVLIPQ